jgi:hypothetical protein
MKISHMTFLLILAMLTTSIRAETINCTPITSVPATITAQGIYCLTGNVATSQSSGNAITINAPNVTIDLNGWKVGGQGAGAGTTAIGIYSNANNVTVKNGIVRGFEIGISLNGSGAVVQDLLTDQNTKTGIQVTGTGALVEHNQVVNTGGSTTSSTVYVYGIEVLGSSSTVSDNTVSGVTATGSANALGIYMDYGSFMTVRNNVVSNPALPSGGGSSLGIYSFTQATAINNSVSNFTYCIYITGIYAQNTVNTCTTDYIGTAGAGNSGT